MATIYTKQQLSEMNVKKELKPLASKLGIKRYSKAPKEWVINAIMASQTPAPQGPETLTIKPEEKQPVPQSTLVPKSVLSRIQFQTTSILTKPNAEYGDKCTSTLHISSGASSGDFPVVGKSVAEVSAFLSEILNIEKLSIGLVKGKEVKGDYILKDGDDLEFLKAAGQKG